MFETLAIKTLLMVLGQILGGDVLEKIGNGVKGFFDSAFDDKHGWEKADEVMEAVGPLLAGGMVFFAKAALEIFVVKYSPKIKEYT